MHAFYTACRMHGHLKCYMSKYLFFGLDSQYIRFKMGCIHSVGSILAHKMKNDMLNIKIYAFGIGNKNIQLFSGSTHFV